MIWHMTKNHDRSKVIIWSSMVDIPKAIRVQRSEESDYLKQLSNLLFLH